MNAAPSTSDTAGGEAWTPGPWEARSHPESSLADAVYAGSDKVAYCQAIFGRPHAPFKQVEANARLIAAAPDLYAALKELIDQLEWVNEQLDLMPDDYAEAQAIAARVLAKARSEGAQS